MRWWISYIILFILVSGRGMLCAGVLPAERWSDGDTSLVVRSPGVDFLEKYRKDAAFDYSLSPKPHSGIWDRIKRWIIERLFRMSMSRSVSQVFDWVMYGFMILFGGWLIWWVLRHRKDLRWRRRHEGVFANDVVEYNGEQGEDTFSRMLMRAEQEGDYALAVRVNYSGLLQVLDKREIIHWQASKTNRDYVYEIRDVAWSTTFSELTRIFDHVCYGEFAVDEGVYRNIKQRFVDFRKEVEV